MEIEKDRARLNPHLIQFVDWDVHTIDYQNRTLLVGTQMTHFDYLVLALGAELAPETIPGFSVGAVNVYTVSGAEEFFLRLQAVEKGPVVILASRMPFKCPPAPYEMAMLVKDYLNGQGKENIPVHVYTPEPFPLPVAGKGVGDIVTDLCSDRDVKIFNGHSVAKIDPNTKVIEFTNGRKGHYELLGGIPPHVAPPILEDSGLLGKSGWVKVDLKTFKTSIDRVWAMGDAVSIPIAGDKALPKAGLFAEKEGDVVAHHIAAEITGMPSDLTFDGKGECYMEVGGGEGVKVSGDFFADPPIVQLSAPSKDVLVEKKRFESERLERWLT